jgi:heat shock protein HslJ
VKTIFAGVSAALLIMGSVSCTEKKAADASSTQPVGDTAITSTPADTPAAQQSADSAQVAGQVAKKPDYKNISYIVDGKRVLLIDGKADASTASGSASRTVTRYFGNEATGDLNGDGVPDVAFLLTQTRGGSGTYYYVVGAVRTADGYKGTSAVPLGDRIAPQTTLIKDGKVTVTYATRAAGESMTAAPTVGKSIVLKLNRAGTQFGEVAQNFEGEANPAKMSLEMKTWTWINTRYSDGKVVTPAKANAFTLTFKDGKVSATTDCNRMFGGYTVSGSRLSFGNLASTRMFCEGSQENEFAKMLGATQGYRFTSKGELVFSLKMDSGTMTFR